MLTPRARLRFVFPLFERLRGVVGRLQGRLRLHAQLAQGLRLPLRKELLPHWLQMRDLQGDVRGPGRLLQQGVGSLVEGGAGQHALHPHVVQRLWRKPEQEGRRVLQGPHRHGEEPGWCRRFRCALFSAAGAVDVVDGVGSCSLLAGPSAFSKLMADLGAILSFNQRS